MKTVISINENGNRMERKVPHALIKTNDPTKELSISYGQYGEVNTEIVDRLPCDERIARQVRQDGETRKGEETNELTKTIETKGKEGPHDIAHEFIRIEKEAEKNNVNLEEVAKSHNMSKEGFIEALYRAKGDNIIEKLKNVDEVLDNDYRNPRNRNS